MSERYTRLLSLPENLYSEGAPVVIAAGALLKDNQADKVLVQLKLRSISAKRIKAVTVHILMKDIAGKELGTPVEHQYLDIRANRNEDFAQKVPVILPEKTTRDFAPSVVRVIFDDNSEWESESGTWTPLAIPERLENALNDAELVSEYKTKFGNQSHFLPCEQKGLWHCSCGAINHKDENTCHNCGLRLAALVNVDWETLNKQKNERLDKEAKEAAERQKRNTRIGLAVAAAALVIGVIAVVIATKPARVIKEAQKIAETGDYMAAVALLDELNMPEKTGHDRGKYIDAMENEIQTAIDAKNYVEALRLIGEYSVLDSAAINTARIQSHCEHQLGEPESADATCEADGYVRRICAICEHVEQTVYPALGHNYKTTAIKNPTCTETGLSKDVCLVCNKEEPETVVGATGHDYAKSVLTSPGCKTDGKAKFTCRQCNNSYTETLKATGHNFSKATCTKDSVCSNCGTINERAFGHTTTTGVCSRCGYNFTPPLTFSGYIDGLGVEHNGINLPKGKYSVALTTDFGWQWILRMDSQGLIDTDTGNMTKTISVDYDLRNGTLVFEPLTGLCRGNYSITIKPIN